MKWTNIYKDEIGLFLGSTGLIFLIRCAGLIFNNFAETVFLKRFGVSFLPILYIINPMITVLLLGKFSSLKLHVSAYGRLFCLLITCSVSSIPIVGMLLLKTPLLYPLLFIMKVQFETLLSVFFWNLGNELFDFHQSKRLFPLMTAGGVLGDMGGNILTVLLSGAVSINHLMLVYGGVLLSAAYLTRHLEAHFPLQGGSGKQAPSSEKKQGIISSFSGIRPLLKRPSLMMVMTGLTFFANAVLPIMNYQFNVAIDHNFAGEQQMIFFLGSFRGAMNIVSMILLFLSGKFYEKWSIPVALMFHPLNYLLIFTAFLFRFDLISAMYARFSTNVIRTTFNQPVNNMLIGIFPDEYRSKIRPFLRGIVARGGLITGSCMILLFRNLLPPQALSLVALPFVLCWITMVGFLKRKYPIFIIKMLSPDTLDLNPTEDHALQRMFREKIIQKKLVENFHTAREENVVPYARLLHYLGVNRLGDQLIYDEITSFQQLNSRDPMDYCNGLFLLVFFNRISKRSMRGPFFTINDLNLLAFFEQELRYAEICLSIMETLKKTPGTLSNRLLQRHLAEIRTGHIRTVLQLAAIKDHSGTIRIILKSLFSRNLRKRANALEAIENVIHPKLVSHLMPFLKGISPEEMLNLGQNHLKVPVSIPVSVNAALAYLLKSNNWVTVRLTRGVLQELIERDLHAEFYMKK